MLKYKAWIYYLVNNIFYVNRLWFTIHTNIKLITALKTIAAILDINLDKFNYEALTFCSNCENCQYYRNFNCKFISDMNFKVLMNIRVI